MTTRGTLWALSRLAPTLQGAARASTSCAGPAAPPPPPPCTPRPPPACRSRPARTVPALRVVCCPPPAARRPPCAPHPPPAPLTCADLTTRAKPRRRSGSCVPEGANVSLNCSGVRDDCGAERDRVARRLALAKAMRREDYEREAAQPRARGRPPAPSYRLGCERECARATDGRDYSVTAECAAECPARCGPARTPPPPRPVRLASDDACRIHAGAHLDPCAHRPRLLLQVDRAPPALPAAAAAHPDPSESTSPPPSTATLKSRIIQTFTQSRRPPDKPSNPVDSKCHQNPQCGRRYLHTEAQSLIYIAARSFSDRPSAARQTGGLEAVLRERGDLKEAGRGRAVCTSTTKMSGHQDLGAGGHLELPVPVGVRRVSVRVALEPAPPPAPRRAAASPAGPCAADNAAARDSWLSIKNIHKKLSSCKRIDDVTTKQAGVACGPERGASPAGPCGAPPRAPPTTPCPCPPRPPRPPRPPHPPPAPAAPSTTPAPCAPSTPPPEKRNKAKPQCRFLPLSLTATAIP